VRVNIEESIKKHLPRLASEMKWSPNEALGQLVRLYGSTQAAGVYEETAPRILTVCALDFDSDEIGERFLTAMIKAQLATVLEDGRIRIRGNDKHVKRVTVYKLRASRGGKASAKARNKKFNDSVTTSAPPSAVGAQASFTPLLPFSNTNTCDKKPSRKKASLPTETHRIRKAFESEYEKKYRQPYLNWDGAHASFAKTLGDSGKADRAIELLPKYFALKITHTFYEGFDSFKAKLNTLNTINKPPPKELTPEEQMAEHERVARESIRELDEMLDARG
jgi:hypothetical protein